MTTISEQIKSYELRLNELVGQKVSVPMKLDQFGRQRGYTTKNRQKIDAINTEIENIKKSLDALYSI